MSAPLGSQAWLGQFNKAMAEAQAALDDPASSAARLSECRRALHDLGHPSRLPDAVIRMLQKLGDARQLLRRGHSLPMRPRMRPDDGGPPHAA